MKSLFLMVYAVLMCLWWTTSTAQTPAVNWGDEFKFEKRLKISGMLSDSTFFYVVKKKTSYKGDEPDLLLERFRSDNVKLDVKMPIHLPLIEGKGSAYFDLLMINNRLWLFLESVGKQGKSGKLYAAEINMDTDSVYAPVLVDDFGTVYPRGEFQLVESWDGKSILILHNHPFEKYNNEKFSYKVFNGKMEKIWAKEIELPYKDRFFKMSHHLLDQHGNVHMISSVHEERSKENNRENGVANNQYNLLSYYPKENLLKEFEISLGDKWVSALTFDMAPDGSLVIAGFYGNSADFSLGGTFYLRMDPISRKIIHSNLKAFEKDFLREFLPEKKVKKGSGLSDFYFDHLIVREDGSAVLVAEQYYMHVVYTYNDPYMNGMYGYNSWNYSPYYRNNYNYQYYYNDLIVVSISARGEIEWAKKIPKRQMSSNDGGYYSSYSLAFNERYVYVLFNDNPRNTPEYRSRYSDLYAMTKPSKSTAMLVTMDREGKFVYSGLFSQKDMNLILRPKMHYQNTKEQLVIFSQRGTRYKFGLLKLP